MIAAEQRLPSSSRNARWFEVCPGVNSGQGEAGAVTAAPSAGRCRSQVRSPGIEQQARWETGRALWPSKRHRAPVNASVAGQGRWSRMGVGASMRETVSPASASAGLPVQRRRAGWTALAQMPTIGVSAGEGERPGLP
jgi:hypothetical protein